MMDYTEAEVAALKGADLSYEFTEQNGPVLEGKSVYAYVAQADINKGITVMGELPAGTAHEFGANEGEDVILSCCRLHIGNSDAENNALIKYYVDNVRSGVFNIPFVTANGNTARSNGGSAAHMAMKCAF